ncbi:hypothetical protein CPC08DRAFT_707712 [Agrocybe pediades]|nr:hypothetical protein CPC08DRAFT_707712 [Agrocybe pediades]
MFWFRCAFKRPRSVQLELLLGKPMAKTFASKREKLSVFFSSSLSTVPSTASGVLLNVNNDPDDSVFTSCTVATIPHASEFRPSISHLLSVTTTSLEEERAQVYRPNHEGNSTPHEKKHYEKHDNVENLHRSGTQPVDECYESSYYSNALCARHHL